MLQELAQDFLKPNYVFMAVGRVGSTSENIEQRFEWVEEADKRRALCNLLDSIQPNALVLTFVETKRGANDLTWFLQRQNVRAVAIHGDLKQFERERNLDFFRQGQQNVLVATAVSGGFHPDKRRRVPWGLRRKLAQNGVSAERCIITSELEAASVVCRLQRVVLTSPTCCTW